VKVLASEEAAQRRFAENNPDGAAHEVPALAALRDLVRSPDGMTAIELDDGQRVFAPAGSSPAEVKRQLAERQSSGTGPNYSASYILRRRPQKYGLKKGLPARYKIPTRGRGPIDGSNGA
jgi:hypothetical protein